ncbi:MAG: AGE family epimerase/isomerase [Bacteroidaceae bacterium]|nr:AGE family epimerase/isomerase [Bacteroidaceae bacterium]
MAVKSPLFLANKASLHVLRREAQECLTQNILPFWLDNMLDHERGGWYGQMTGDGIIVKDAPRGAILYARLLWTLSAAYRVFSSSSDASGAEYLEAATKTKDYILAHFVDREYGGTYWSVTADGEPLDTKKQFYAQGFMLYGFSEYARATGDEEALEIALQLFNVIERHGWDSEHGGYIEACTRDWQPIADMRLSAKDENFPKSQNTHLHIIEPYTNLLKNGPTPNPSPREGKSSPVAKAVSRLISLFTHRILNPETHHLELFFDMDWTRKSTTESYGHDIECSWLLHEAALALGDKAILNKVEPVVKEVAAASEKGLQPDGSMIYEGEPDGSHFDRDRHWWVQAEAVVGFFNLYQHFCDETALNKAWRLWQYIKDHLIDHERGEWYWSIREDGSVNLDDDHAGFWKCPYHNGRMCLELIERIDTMIGS